MIKPITIKDSDYEQTLLGIRLIASAIIVLVLLIILVIRIGYLQISQYEHYSTLAANNRIKVKPIAPIRGLIFSRDGVLLAENRPSFSLEIIPEEIKEFEQTVERLKKIINIEETDIERYKKLKKKKRLFEGVPLRFNLSEKEVAAFSVQRHEYLGVDVVARLNRHYPLGRETVHTVGYVGRIDEEEIKKLDVSNYRGTTHIGKLGVEKAYENILHGKVGFQEVEVNAQGRVIRVLERTAPEPGKNLQLTLDVSLQQLAMQTLEGQRGAIVALDPNNGDILAMVSSPSYDPNPFVNGIDVKSYKDLLNSRDTPLINRVLQGKYPPGSTLKPFLGITAMESGLRRYQDQTWCPGFYSLKNNSHRYRDWKKSGHGQTDLGLAITQSCDVYFYALAYDLGINRLHDALAEFGFGNKTGIDIAGESSGLLPSREWKRQRFNQAWYPGETLIMGIGQGYALSTPIQLAKATTAIANRGFMTTPRLVDRYIDALHNSFNLIEPAEKVEIKLKNPQHWNKVIKAMRDVLHGQGGTAWRSGLNAEYEFAGKTGTAQVISIAQDEEYDKDKIAKEHQDHALFIAFAPIETPQIAIAIIVENGGGGSTAAAPIARKLFDHYLLKNNRLVNNG